MERILVGVDGSPTAVDALRWAANVAARAERGSGGFRGLRLGRVPLPLVHHRDATIIIVAPPPNP